MKKALCVDDSLISAKSISRALEGLLETDFVPDLPEALSKVVQEDYSLFIIEYNLHTGGGMRLGRMIRAIENHANTPIVMLSSDLREPVAFAAAKSGINCSLPKPVAASVLRETVERQLSNPSFHTVRLSRFETRCIEWRVDNIWYQYSPELNQRIAGASKEEVRSKVQKALQQQYQETSDVIIFVEEIGLVSYNFELSPRD